MPIVTEDCGGLARVSKGWQGLIISHHYDAYYYTSDPLTTVYELGTGVASTAFILELERYTNSPTVPW